MFIFPFSTRIPVSHNTPHENSHFLFFTLFLFLFYYFFKYPNTEVESGNDEVGRHNMSILRLENKREEREEEDSTGEDGFQDHSAEQGKDCTIM